MDTGTVISVVLLFCAIAVCVASIVGIVQMFFSLIASAIMNKRYPPYSCTKAMWAVITSLFYIILFITGHVQF